MHVVLETDRLLLRQFTAADEDNLVELDSDPEVMRFLSGGRPTPREVIRRDVLPRILRDYQQYAGRFGLWAAVAKADGRFLGWFELRPRDGGSPDEVELGYRLRREFWGQGYATEGARALVHKAFTDLNVRRVFAETMAVNTASRRVMEKAGLHYVRTFHLDWDEPIAGSEHGEVEYALTRSDWEHDVAAESGHDHSDSFMPSWLATKPSDA